MAKFNEKDFITGLNAQTAKLTVLINKLKYMAEVASRGRIRLDSEAGKDYLRNLNVKSFFKEFDNVEDFQKAMERSSKGIVKYIKDGLLECPKHQIKSIKKLVEKYFEELKKKNSISEKGYGLDWANKKYIMELFFKFLDRILELSVFGLEEAQGEKPSPSVLWGGMRWKVIPASYAKTVSARPHKPKSAKKGGGASHCNGWNHKPGCSCGWGGCGYRRRKHVSPQPGPVTKI